MPVETFICPQHLLVYVKYSGIVSLTETRHFVNDLRTSPLFRPGMSEIVDLREVEDVTIKFSTMMLHAGDISKVNSASAEPTKMAIIEGTDLVYGMAFMFKSVMDAAGGQVDVTIVSSEAAALKTVGLSSRSLDDIEQHLV